MTAVSFTVYGLPAPQGSKRALVHRSTGRAVVIESAGQRVKDWRGDVKDAAAGAMLGQMAAGLAGTGPLVTSPTLLGPLLLSVAFTMPKPKSAPKTRRTWPDRRPDLDKLVRAVMDALTGIVFADDAQVIRLQAAKSYPGEEEFALDRPGAAITVRTAGGSDE